ncbi:DUF2066 domain-containing protein [Pseudomonas matsuisoli]|uniref:DUF2066 domain-containing protein n=1 Tax=Pseudomonas matsuisoli TaxID=1515666 RepID=A0A917URT5_9PSED|nr:DUF2066 domain-containing protein [Pseudomonas matsuisoli]GGJ81121.1 hypothetical protein GCM10009304_03760 [Pseudomonas matsuisoli]
MRFTPRLVLTCLALSALPLHAATLDDLYQVREPVSSQQPDARDQALQAAFETLVLRLTGKKEAASDPSIAALKKDPQQVVSQYGYEADRLVVDFDPLTTERALRQAGLPLWGASRPALLTWWLDRAEDGTNNLAGDNQAAANALREAARYRGLPLRLPLADLEEQLVATTDNLANPGGGALTDASQRYDADGILTVRAAQQDGVWRADWQLALGEQQEKGSAQADSREGLADAIMLTLSERLAPRFAITPGASSTFDVQISGVTLDRYAELQRALEPFGAQMLSIEGADARYRVNASEQQLRAQLELIQLTESSAPPPAAQAIDANAVPAPAALDPAAPKTLYFSW